MTRLSCFMVALLLCVAAGCNSNGNGTGDGSTGFPPDDGNSFLPPPIGGGDGFLELIDDEDGDDAPDGGDSTDSGYRKVTIAGTVATDHNEATVDLDPGEGMTLFEYVGDCRRDRDDLAGRCRRR